MPLLKRKRLPEIKAPNFESGDKAMKKQQVWYMHMTHEIFTEYEYPF
jgi:hypothetical protein